MERLKKLAKKGFNRSKPDDKSNENSNSTRQRSIKIYAYPRVPEEDTAELETDFKEHKFSHTWLIKNMHLCNVKCEKFLQSPSFSTRFGGEIEWALRVYPRGRNLPRTSDTNRKICDYHQSMRPFVDQMQCKSEYFGLFLFRVSKHPVNACMRYRLVCKRYMPSKLDVHSHPRKKDLELFDLNSTDASEYGTDYLFCRQDFEGPETLVIKCDIYIIGVVNMGVPSNCDAGTLKSDTLINDFQKMLETGNFSDITLEARDVKFRAHKSILASRSQVFAAMFQHDMQEARSNVIQVEDIEPEVLRSLLQYIYTGRVEDFDAEKAMSLYAASDKYLMEELKKWCTDMMLKHMTVENVCRIAVLADMHPGSELKESALYMFCNYTSDIFKRKEWNDLVKDANHHDLVSEILLYVSSDFTTDCEDE